MYTIRLENTVTHQIYEQQVEDHNNGEKMYFRFGVSTFDLGDGEYILTLLNAEGDVLAEDLMRIGDYNPEAIQYSKGENTYIDVTLNAVLQEEKYVTINEIETRIVPDLGNDAIETVYVNAQPLYDSAYNSGYENGYNEGFENSSYASGYDDGYTSGYESGSTDGFNQGFVDGVNQGFVDGVNEQKNKLEQITVTENGIYEKEDGYNKVTVDIDLDTPYNNGYGDGYKDGTDDFIGKLTDLTVTENGIYKTKYSEGDDFATGDNFYDYASLHNKVYNTNMYFHKDLSFDVWFRITAEIPNDDLSADIDILSILGAENKRYSGFPLRLQFLTLSGEEYHFSLRYGNYYFILPNISVYEWAHIKVDSSTREVSVNGVPYTDVYLVVEDETETDGERFLPVDRWGEVEDVVSDLPITLGYVNNSEDVPPVGIATAFEDVDLGMVIIDGVKFIPTPNGYKRANTDEYLEEIPVYIANGEDISYVFHNIEVVSVLEEGAFKTVYVNVPNESFDKGYEQGQADAAANARVLEVTENGTYMSKFSTPIIPPLVTGVYDDGSEFYSYASIIGSVYDTGIPAEQSAKIEFWWKNTDAAHKTYAAILGGQTFEGYIIKFAEYDANTYRIEYGNYKKGKLFEYNFAYDMTSQWNHIVFSKKDGLYVNGEFICNIQGEVWAENEIIPNFWINAAYAEEVNNNANGTFGMIKINDVVIIPTSDGFLNVNTGELLGIVQGGDYTYTENIPKYGEGEMYKTINVNVFPSVNVSATGLRFAYSTFETIPEWADFTNISNMGYMFFSCTNLQELPNIDTSNVKNMLNAFGDCSNLHTIPQFDTSNVTDMEGMFIGCANLQTIPPIDTSNVIDMYSMFYIFGGNKNLVSLPKFECGKVENMSRYFSYYADGMSSLTDVGGWENLKCDWNDRYGLASCPNLTYQSCINILNGLYDFVGNGESTTKTLKVNPNFLTTVGDDISIGTSKGWTIIA